ncbi:MAG: type II toxin-antitoxin system Phd/YefM family antitoxin [Acidimicrobiales bacterium]
MTKTIPQRELRNENTKVIDEVIAGTSFVVTRNGVPVAELRPVKHERRTFVSKVDLAPLAVAQAHVNAETFRSDLDRAVNQDL